MPEPKRVKITVVDMAVQCDPPSLTLKPRETVQWVSGAQIVIDFGTNSPFKEGNVFRNNDVATMRDDAGDGVRLPTITVTLIGHNVGGVDFQHN